MSNIILNTIINAIEEHFDKENPDVYIYDYSDLNIRINTICGELPVLSVHLSKDGKTVEIDVEVKKNE